MTREEMRDVISRHHGSIQALAGKLGCSHTAVSLWLRDRTNSKRFEPVIRRHVLDLLEQERRVVAGNGRKFSHKNLSPAGRIA